MEPACFTHYNCLTCVICLKCGLSLGIMTIQNKKKNNSDNGRGVASRQTQTLLLTLQLILKQPSGRFSKNSHNGHWNEFLSFRGMFNDFFQVLKTIKETKTKTFLVIWP